MKISNKERFKSLPDLILFDLDNTLYHYDPAHEAALKAVRAKVCEVFSVSKAQFDKAFKEARKQVHDRLGDVAGSHNRLLYMQRMLEILGLGPQVVLTLDLEQTYWRTFLSSAVLFPDVKKFLDDLRLLNIQKIIVTDLTAQIQFRKIVYFGLENYFNGIVTSEESGRDKPAADSFKLAVEKANGAGKNIWMIGDSAAKDIAGARQHVNAVTLQKLHSGIEEGAGKEAADAVFENFAELRKLVQKLAGKK